MKTYRISEEEECYPSVKAVFSDTGLGMKFVFDEINKIYGKDFIKY